MKKLFAVTISGIPYAWTTSTLVPTSIGGVTYTIKAFLDHKSIRISKDRWDLRGGKGTPGGLSFRLFDVGEFCTSFFSSELLSADSTTLMGAKAVSGGGGETIEVYEHSAFPATGTLYIGLETVTYTGKTNSGGGVPYDYFSGVQRACYGSPGYAHPCYSFDDPGYQSNPIVSDHPYVWDGRYVTLYQYEVDDTTGALGAARTLWRGYLRGGPVTAQDGTISLKAVSLLEILNRKVGVNPGAASAQTTAELQAAGVPDWDELPEDLDADDLFYYRDSDTDIGATLSVMWSNGTLDVASFKMGVSRDLNDLSGSYSGAGYGMDTLTYHAILDVQVIDGAVRIALLNLSTAHSCTVHWEDHELARALGYDSVSYPEFGYVGIPGISQIPALVAERSFSRTFHSSKASRIYLADSTISLPAAPTAGTAILSRAVEVRVSNSDGETREVLQANSVDTTTDTVNGPFLEVLSRGVIGDPGMPLSFPLWTDESSPITIRQVLCAAGISAGMLCRYILASFAGSGYNGQGDILPQGWGGELPAAYLHEVSFGDLSGPLSDGQYWVLDEETTIGDILGPICQIEGAALACVEGLLVAYRVATHAARGAIDVTDASSLVVAPVLAQDGSLLINSIKPKIGWSFNKQTFLNAEHTLTDIRAQSWVTGYQTMEVKHKGIRQISDAEMAEDLDALKDDLFLRFGLPSYVVVLELQEHELGTGEGPGTTLSLTLTQVRNPFTGSIGITSILAQIWDYEHDPIKGTIKVTALLQRQSRRLGHWSPALEVTAYDGGTGVLSIDADEMSYPDATDTDHIDVGDQIVIYREANETITGSTTVLAVGASSITIAAAFLLSDAAAPAAGDRVRQADWATATTGQHRTAYVADHTVDLLDNADDPFHWE